MPNWSEILSELISYKSDSGIDVVRRKYLKEVSNITGRNVIAIYSGWLQHKDVRTDIYIDDNDINALMTVIHRLDRTKGLDLILHTPGGEVSATEAVAEYLKSMFGNDIRAIIPQIAMSAGTMIACACKQILIG
ncbi:periplasmic serine protease [Candidatus Magnetoovum chiemensis]|nr:periplasmic serine protease [Candidatus Magnetoovum chiemensis]